MMKENVRPVVLLASVLKAERWTSIDLHREDTLRAFAESAPEWEVVDIAPDERLAATKLGKKVLRDLVYPLRVRREAGRWLRRTGVRPIVHVIDHSYGHLCRVWSPVVVTCHDLNHHVAPIISGAALRAWKIRVGGLKKADHVFTVSGHLAGEVMQHLEIPRERISVAYNGVDRTVFRRMPEAEARGMLPEMAALARRHLLILNVGSNIKRKNLPTVLRALALLRQERGLPVKLIKAGASLREDGFGPLMEELGVTDAVVDLGMQTPRQVAALCNLAQVLSFASLYEGFGRPTLEAQACALPCVLADASCMREVGGDGALYHAGTDHQELAARLEQAMRLGPERDALLAAGCRNVERFTWAAHVRSLTKVYERWS